MQHVSANGFSRTLGNRRVDVPMRVIWKASAVTNREMVQHQEWAEVLQLRRPNRAADSRTSAFGLLDRLKGLGDFARAQHDFWNVDYLVGGGFKQRRGGDSAGSGVVCDGGCRSGGGGGGVEGGEETVPEQQKDIGRGGGVMFPTVVGQVDAEHPNRQLIEHAHFECGDGLCRCTAQGKLQAALVARRGLAMVIELWGRCVQLLLTHR